MTVAEQFKKAWMASTPLLAIRTIDPAATVATISQVTNGAPIVVWDMIRGLGGFNEKGRATMDETFKDVDPAALSNPVEVLVQAHALPKHTILFLINMHMSLQNPVVIQALWNLRDHFKQDRRTAVMLGCSFDLPATIAQDVIVLDEPLPDTAQLAAIVLRTYSDAQLPKPGDDTVWYCVDAICGLGAFAAEQVCAMSISADGMDVDALWERKRQTIEQTQGLTVYRGKEKTTDVKGAENCIEFCSNTMTGDPDPSCVVFLDEIDKMFSGMGNDQDSTTKELVGRFLKWCDKKNSKGQIMMFGIVLLGPPGTGKSMIAKAIGNQFKRPTIECDISSMKDSLVGESMHNVDQAFKIIDAVAGEKPKLLIATCNSMATLPPEVRRRFFFGTFFVDFPTDEARAELWTVNMKDFRIVDKKLPDDAGWTGAEIRNCCMIAAQQRIPLTKAASYIVPVAKSAAEQIAQLRRDASGRYISAAKPELYRAPEEKSTSFPSTVSRRSISTKN